MFLAANEQSEVKCEEIQKIPNSEVIYKNNWHFRLFAYSMSNLKQSMRLLHIKDLRDVDTITHLVTPY